MRNWADSWDYLGPKPSFILVGVYDEISLLAEENGLLEEVVLDTSLNHKMDEGQLHIFCKVTYIL